MGTVYLLHFDRAYKHARHYLGYTDNLDKRIERHRSGEGARLLRVIRDHGIGFSVVRTWEGDRKLERRIKKSRNTPSHCPVCKAEKAAAKK